MSCFVRWERITTTFSTQFDIRADIHIAISTRQTIDTKRREDLSNLRDAELNVDSFCRSPSASHAPTLLVLHISFHPVSLFRVIPPKQMTDGHLTVAKHEGAPDYFIMFYLIFAQTKQSFSR
ncbi:hypothetical protein BLNAU_22535 [Blattamonas nauphoetae]|uniref:Uncharacterized protein n=1 Tax=Blattamonas nauphoetae TaxID=2049346 RepID=A0ABQ9WSS5_9EUKA|nr:hypothetical protein BLNAU_22535 [Blattamonas nauphoetae]